MRKLVFLNLSPYKYDASRFSNAQCGVCQYHLESLHDECDENVVKYCHKPFIAYCLDGSISKRLSCVQDEYSRPSFFFGKFFYPLQKPLDSMSSAPMHWFLLGPDGDPTDDYYVDDPEFYTNVQNYGISRRNIKRNIYHSMATVGVETYAETGQSDMVTEHRNTWNSDTHWTMWGQLNCMEYCHRNDMLLAKYVDASDFDSANLEHISIKNYYINQMQYDYQYICKGCFRGTDVVWDKDESDLTKNMAGYADCLPWMGAVPVIHYDALQQKHVLSSSMRTLDRQITLSKDASTVYEYGTGDVLSMKYFDSMECKSGFYNRICPYSLINRAAAQDPSINCTQCPGGWHTDGEDAAWFCIPPLGKIFSHGRKLRYFWNTTLNQSSAWQRRDLLKYEFECGAQCLQCQQQNISGTAGLTGDQFNEQFIFEPLLQVQDCPANSYCPHPLHSDSIRCPSNRSCSPAGSHSLNNCTCCEGEFWNQASGRCETCSSKTACQVGSGLGPQFLKGETACLQSIGDKADGVCTPCTSKPDNSEFINGTLGFEIQKMGIVSHFCPFRCMRGYQLKTNDAADFCFRTYTCEPLDNARLVAEMPLGEGTKYGTDLANLYDRVTFNVPQETCTPTFDLTQRYNTLKTTNWAGLSMVSSTCYQVNPSECSAVDGKYCSVSRDATYYQDFECVPCDPLALDKPLNSQYLPETLNMTTLSVSRSKMCSWKCDNLFYKNGSECMACDALSRDKCPDGYSIRGMGCLGISSPFNEADWTSNCVNCDKDQSSIPSNKYLSVERCDYMDCPSQPSLVSNHYFSQRCGGGTSPEYIQTPCSLDCPADQYRVASCSINSDIQCNNCTLFKRGHYTTNKQCLQTADSVWVECPTNSYCPGYGSREQCPLDRISKPGSFSLSDCKCGLGTVESSVDASKCVAKTCDGDVDSDALPTLATENQRSNYYFFLNDNLETQCVFCDSSSSRMAYTLGGRTLGIDSCRCPENFYSFAGNDRNVTCHSCAVRQHDPSCSTRAANAMWWGSLDNTRICSGGSQSGHVNPCVCVVPPFANKISQSTCQWSGCAAGYDLMTSDPDFPSFLDINVTGSQTYYQDTGGWKKGIFMNAGALTDLKSTSNYNSNSPSSEQKFYLLFFAVEGHRDKVYIQTVHKVSDTSKRFRPELSELSQDSAAVRDATGVEYTSWQVFSDAHLQVHKKILKLAIAKWPFQIPLNVMSGASNDLFKYWTWMSALVYDRETNVYEIGVQMIYPAIKNSQYFYDWDPSLKEINLAIGNGTGSSSLTADTEIVDIYHAYSFPSMDIWRPPSVSPQSMVGRYGGFYVAYNNPTQKTCGIHAVFHSRNYSGIVPTSTRLHLDLSNITSGRRIQALTVVENENGGQGVWIYVLFDDNTASDNIARQNNEGVLLVKWDLNSKVSHSDSAKFSLDSVELVIPKRDTRGRKLVSFRSLMQIWSSYPTDRSFVMIGEVQAPSGGSLPIVFTANGATRTFTEIQGMPDGSHPSMLTGFETSNLEFVLIGKGVGRSVFYLEPLERCFYSRKYFDGKGACKSHHCVRNRACRPEQNKKMDGSQCVCKDGFQEIQPNQNCIECPRDKYCIRGQPSSCPLNHISNSGSSSADHCRCQAGHYHDSTTCRPCPLGSFCPNGWNEMKCPGDSKRTTLQAQTYPVNCECLPGSEGANCSPCPEGHRCFFPLIPISDKTNVAVSISVKAKTSTVESMIISSADLIRKAGCEDTLQWEISAHFGQSSYNLLYLKPESDGGELSRRFYCQFIPSSNVQKTPHMFMVMLQLDLGDASASVLSNVFQLYTILSDRINNMTSSTLLSLVEIIGVQPENNPYSFNLVGNKVEKCSQNMVPTESRESCTCAPGHFFYLSKCIPCPVNFFKSVPGPEACRACPAGTVTLKAGSIFCNNTNGDGGQSQGDSSGSGNNMIAIIAGGVVGGIVFLLLVIFVYYSMVVNKQRSDIAVSFNQPNQQIL